MIGPDWLERNRQLGWPELPRDVASACYRLKRGEPHGWFGVWLDYGRERGELYDMNDESLLFLPFSSRA